MSIKSPYISFYEGPFASASANAHLLTTNIYFSLLFQASIDAQLEIEKDYEILLQGDNIAEIEAKKKQLDYAENLLGLNILCTMIDEELES